MQADFARRRELNGADLTVDDIQTYHRDVFEDVAGAPANAWTPDMYLETFETFEERQAAWDNMLANNSVFTFYEIQARKEERVNEYLEDNPQITVSSSYILDEFVTLGDLLRFGIDSVFANWLVDYTQYLTDLAGAGIVSVLYARPNGPYEVGVAGAGAMIGGNGGDNTLVGTAGDDVMNGQSGDDTFIGGDGADRFHGGSGDDTADYSFDSAGIIIQLGALQGGTADEWAATNEESVVQRIQDGEGNWDFAIGVEVIVGTAHDDRVSFFGAAGDYFNADDVDTLLQGGGNTDLGDVLDFSALTNIPSGLTAIWDASGTINFNAGSWAAAGSAEGFEAVIGSTANDFISGGDGEDRINGNLGADQLFGGGADDFIFFDAEDTAVYGGAGRDVAVALGTDGVTVDMTAQGLECVIGCNGDDTIFVTEDGQPFFAAGGGGADHFVLDNLEAHAPRILWGGAGADVFEFQNGGRVSLAVVNIAGLTEEAFSRLTVADLGLGDVDVSLLSAIIINPDATDRFSLDGVGLGTSSVNLQEWWEIGDDPDFLALLLPGSTPVSLDVRTTDVLGGSYAVQGVYRNEVRAVHEITLQYNYRDVTVRSDGGYKVVNTDTYEEGLIRWNEETGQAITTTSEIIEDALMIAEQVFAQFDQQNYGHVTSEYWTVQESSDTPTGPFYVVGGAFAGNVLSANGDLSGSLPTDPGPSPFDWLLAA